MLRDPGGNRPNGHRLAPQIISSADLAGPCSGRSDCTGCVLPCSAGDHARLGLCRSAIRSVHRGHPDGVHRLAEHLLCDRPAGPAGPRAHRSESADGVDRGSGCAVRPAGLDSLRRRPLRRDVRAGRRPGPLDSGQYHARDVHPRRLPGGGSCGATARSPTSASSRETPDPPSRASPP